MVLLLALLACAPRHPPTAAAQVDDAALRRASIASLEGLLASGAFSEQQRPDAMMRLAELYRDEARALFLEEQERAIAREPR